MILSSSNPRVKWVRALQSRRKARETEGVFVIEGQRLMREALESAVQPRLVLHTDNLSQRSRGMVNSMLSRGAEVMIVSDAVMAACSDLESAPRLLAVLDRPSLSLPERLDLVLIVDGLSDPGNLGTMLRTALAAGVQAVYLTKGTVDAFNPKVIRGAMGAHFHLPLRELAPPKAREALGDLRLWLADAQGGIRYDQVDWTAPTALVIGNEVRGGSQALRDVAQDTVHIPMPGAIESLNAAVAAAVILYEILRQRGVA